MKKSTRSRLTEKQIAVFPGNSLFDKIARAVCRAGTLPGKELFEAWEVARRIRRKYRGGRVVDLACGHGLLAHIMLLLDGSSSEALAVDLDFTENTRRLSEIIIDRWPRLKSRINYLNSRIEDIDLNPDDIAVSVHACGRLTDTIIETAVEADARLAVLPCCHDTKLGDLGGLGGWVDGPLAIDVTRAARLRAKGYCVITQTIPKEITPKNRLLMAHPELVRKPGKVGVAYGSGIAKVQSVLLDVAQRNREVLKTPAPRVRFRAFGDSSLDHELLCWVEKPVLRGRMSHTLNSEVYKRFLKESIEIPFPQRDINLKPALVPAETS